MSDKSYMNQKTDFDKGCVRFDLIQLAMSANGHFIESRLFANDIRTVAFGTKEPVSDGILKMMVDDVDLMVRPLPGGHWMMEEAIGILESVKGLLEDTLVRIALSRAIAGAMGR